MKRWLAYPVLWCLLVAMWVVLGGAFAATDLILGALVATGATLGLRRLQLPGVVLRRPRVALELACLVVADVVRSNLAVAWLVMRPTAEGRVSGFVRIPLELRNPAGIAALACIITSTPGTAWARYDSTHGILTMHVLDLVEPETWIRTIKERYERRLLEVFR
jgi:multicomponent K+:H+ antiporter subunit E